MSGYAGGGQTEGTVRLAGMSMKLLLLLSGGLEASGGAVSLIAPTLVIDVLFGVSADAVSVVLARFFGAGILSFGLAAVLACRHADSPAGLGVAYGVMCYNLIVALLLIWAVAAVELGGVILWAAGIGHALLGLLFLRAVIGYQIKGR